MVLRTAAAMPIKAGRCWRISMRWKTTDPHSPSGRWRDDADRQRRELGLQVVVLSGIVWVVTGTLTSPF